MTETDPFCQRPSGERGFLVIAPNLHFLTVAYIISRRMRYPFFKKADILLAVLLLALGAGSLALLRSEPSSESSVGIYVDGELYGSRSLSEDWELAVTTRYGNNRVSAKSGLVTVTDSDCEGKDCLRMGPVSKEGQLILCLPHRLMIIIEGSGGVDSVVY